jgi:hypothetical protein
MAFLMVVQIPPFSVNMHIYLIILDNMHALLDMILPIPLLDKYPLSLLIKSPLIPMGITSSFSYTKLLILHNALRLYFQNFKFDPMAKF